MLLITLITILFLTGYFIGLLLKSEHRGTLTIASLFGITVYIFYLIVIVRKESVTISHIIAIAIFQLWIALVYGGGIIIGAMVRWLAKRYGKIYTAMITLPMLAGIFSYNPMPSDEKMIAYFQAHREEFDALAQNFRAYIPQHHPYQAFNTIPQDKALMDKVAIQRIQEYGVAWFPDPYSAEAARQFELLKKQAGKDGLEFIHPFMSIRFTLQNQALGHPNIGLWDWLTKDYVYFPEIPKIEDGRLWYPVNTTGQMKSSELMAFSLNRLPLGWTPNCVYRQMEPHWFLLMCYQH